MKIMNNYEENYKNGRTYLDDSSGEDENLSTKSEDKMKKHRKMSF